MLNNVFKSEITHGAETGHLSFSVVYKWSNILILQIFNLFKMCIFLISERLLSFFWFWKYICF